LLELLIHHYCAAVEILFEDVPEKRASLDLKFDFGKQSMDDAKE
jgi:hypothetical protein